MIMFSDRLRPNVEAAPWVIECIKALEDKIKTAEELHNKLIYEITNNQSTKIYTILEELKQWRI